MKKNYSAQDLDKSFALAVAIMLFANLALNLVFAPFMKDGALPDLAYWAMQAMYTCLVGLSAVLYAKISKANFLSATTANKPPKWAHVLWGCVADVFLIAAMLPLNNWICDLIEKLGLTRPSVEMPLQLAPMLLVACVLPAVTEEFVFRGTVGQSLRNVNKLASLAISGALFALFHLNAAQTVHQFVLGAFLTLVMFRSGSVWTSVIVHFFNNAFAVALTFVFLDESVLTPYFLPMFFVGLAGFALCVFGYVKCTKSSWTRENDSLAKEQSSDTSSQNEQSRQLNVLSLVFAVGVCLVLWVANLVLKQ